MPANTHIVRTSYGWEECRLTSLHIVVGRAKYRQGSGALVGGSGYNRPSADPKSLRPLDDAGRRILTDQAECRSLAAALPDRVKRCRDLSVLRQIAALLADVPDAR